MANKMLKCIFCRTPEQVDKGTRSVLCGNCVAKLAGAPHVLQKKVPKLTKAGKPRQKRGTAVKKVPSGKPRGWHFKMCYVHTDGTVWSRGQLVTDTKKANTLKKEHA